MHFSFASCLPFLSCISVCFPLISSFCHAILVSYLRLLPSFWKGFTRKVCSATIKSNQYRITSDFQQAASFFSHHFFPPLCPINKRQVFVWSVWRNTFHFAIRVFSCMCFLKITLLNQIHIRMTVSNCTVIEEEFIFSSFSVTILYIKNKVFYYKRFKRKKIIRNIFWKKKKKVQNINGDSFIILIDLYMWSPGWISHIAALDALM